MAATIHYLTIKKGTTSNRISIFVQNSSVTTGAGLTGLTNASAGLIWYYWREDAGDVGATSVSLVAGTRGTYSSGGFKEKDATNMPGCYEIGIPNAVLSTGANWAKMMLLGATNMSPVIVDIQLEDATLKDINDKTTLLQFDASNFVKSTHAFTTFTVVSDAANGAAQFKTDRSESTDNYWKDCWVKITSGALSGQVRKIISYNGTNKFVTLSSALTGTPAAGVTGDIINE